MSLFVITSLGKGCLARGINFIIRILETTKNNYQVIFEKLELYLFFMLKNIPLKYCSANGMYVHVKPLIRNFFSLSEREVLCFNERISFPNM